MIAGEHVPDETRIYAWIEEVFAQGVRRPGYPADRWAEQWAQERFRAFGLERVRAEPVDMHSWEPEETSLLVRGDDGAEIDAPCFALPHCARTDGLDARLMAYDADAPERVRGAISLYDMPLVRVPHGYYRHIATWTFDPDGSFDDGWQMVPFGREFQDAMEPSMAAGAIGFVGVLREYPGDSFQYYVPYDGKERAVPGVWISGSDGVRVRAMLAAGRVQARVVVRARRERITSYNIIGELAGADDETVIIGSHHDGPWSSAVEDASGVAMVLAQAAYWSRVPDRERPHRLTFLLNAGHMAGGAGQFAFVQSHAADLERLVLELHLEHAANEFAEVDGVLRATGRPEARWWFTSRIERLEAAVRGAIEAEDLRRSYILPPDAFGPKPTTDAADFYPAGVPVVNFLVAPFYLFDAMDTLDKIDRPGLVPITRAAIRIVESTAGVSAAQFRQEDRRRPA
ncbi:MAG: M28 family peptidase [Dehalococcoidia bacterium]